MHLIKQKLTACLRILQSAVPTYTGDINWLNEFCAEFLAFSSIVQQIIGNDLEYECQEVICLCLTQIIICIRHLEYTIQTESTSGLRIKATHHHFIDRITVCLKRLCASLESYQAQDCPLEGACFLTLLDTQLDSLSVLTNPTEDSVVAQEDLLELSRQTKLQIDLLLGQALSFANVALQQDKKALSALCQKVCQSIRIIIISNIFAAQVMRDCSAFQEECAPNSAALSTNYSNQKLRALTLEHALYQLEEYINETLLRLVFTCFLDFQKISVDKIRNVLRTGNDSIVDEYIADFDVNLDRATQIGIFSIAFAPSLKIKTVVRSCLASFEYLDTSLIPSLQSSSSDLHSEILEQHFKEELHKFKTVLHEIIDSRAFVGCYSQILANGIDGSEKHFDKAQLEDLVQMGFFILEHFQLDVNRKVISADGQQSFQNFVRILRECKAILMCASQVHPSRIMKRFKILRTIVRKFHNNVGTNEKGNAAFTGHIEHVPVIEADTENSSALVASPSRSILYETGKKRGRDLGNRISEKTITEALKLKAPGCIRRKESLRTTMFKRKRPLDANKLQNTLNNESATLEIS
ncbi:hypothetical protein KR222_006457, partial [Zaprionus bogoriensis]